MLVLSGCFACSCVWFQVMNIQSIRLTVSTSAVPRRSVTALLSLQEVPQVLHLHLHSRRSLLSSRSNLAKLCQKCNPRSSGQGVAATPMRQTKIPLWSTARSGTAFSLPFSLMCSRPRRTSMWMYAPLTQTIWRRILNTLVKLFRCALN